MYIDSHSHLNLEQFDTDYADVISRMQESGVRTQTVGVDIESSQRAIELSIEYPDVSRAIVGIHPAYVEQDKDYLQDCVTLRQLATHDLCVGIGECGFDFFRSNKADVFEAQLRVFESQIQIASDSNKPLMLHMRPARGTHDAYNDSLDVLERCRGEVVGQAHFFAGTTEHARRFLDLGYYISCTGVVTFSTDYDELIRYVPLDRLLLETDAPYVAPVPFRGGRCEPIHVIRVYERIAQVLGIDISSVIEAIQHNVRALYKW
jgi:TatD DNase family protein